MCELSYIKRFILINSKNILFCPAECIKYYSLIIL